MSPPLFELASNWQWVTFADVATVASNLVDPAKTPDAAHIAPNHIESWTGSLLPYGTIQDDGMTSAKHQFRAGHILYSKIRPYLAKAALATFDGLCSADMYPIETSLEPSFLLRWMLTPSFTNAASRTQGRTVLPKINREALNRLPVPVAPKGEQRRIVAKLDAIFHQTRAAKARLERLPALLEKLKRSILAAAFRGDLTADWRAANPDVEPASALLDRIRAERRRGWEDSLRVRGKEPTKANYEPPAPVDLAEPTELPAGWAWASLDEVATSIRNGISPKPADAPPGIPILRISSVRPMNVDLNERRYLRDISVGDDSYLRDGDLLFTRYNGTLSLVGVAGVVEGCDGPLLYPDKLIRVRTVIDAKLVMLAAHTESSRRYLEEIAKSSAGQTGISGADLRRLPIAVPPASEARVLVALVERALTEISSLADRGRLLREGTDRLEQAALAKAFRGELVPQDPTDEPASVLLDRIRTARAAEPAKSGRGRAARREQPAPTSPTTEPRAATSTGDPLDLVVAVFQQGSPRLTASAIIDVTGLRATAVTTALEALVAGGQVRVHGRAKGTTYEWSA